MATEVAASSSTAGLAEEIGERPTAHLPWLQLLQISIYWFGINAIWGGWEVLNQERVPVLFGQEAAGRGLLWIEILMALVAIAVQPTAGSISDYTVSRFGRRKPYIMVGAVLDVVFLVALATASVPLFFVAFLLLLEFSSNMAQGPFQGYIPDLVPDEQVGTASALVGLMTLMGVIAGVFIFSQGIDGQNYLLPALVVGTIEVATMVGTVAFVREGREAKPREGKSWSQIAREAWGTDILRQRSYVWLLVSRLFILGGGAFVGNLTLIWMQRAVGLSEADRGEWVSIAVAAGAVGVLLATWPAARLSDRVGRKPIIWVACAVGATGTAIFAFATRVEFAVLASFIVGAGSGMFIAVDWALLSELVPKASSGRYMGMSNLSTALQGVIALVFGGLVLDIVANGFFGVTPDFAGSARWAIATGVVLYLVGALLLIPVKEPARRRTSGGGLAALGGAG
jgi:MFS family permease